MRNESDMIWIMITILGICVLLLSFGTISRCNRLQSAQESMERRIYGLERILEDRK